MDHGRRRWRVIWAGGTVALAVVVTAGVAAGNMHGGLPARVLSGHGMGGAAAFAVDGGHVWAIRDAAHGAGSVLELNASNGSWVRTISGGRYGFRYPAAIAAGGGHLWVANDPQTGGGQTPKPGDGSVTELDASDGSWVRTLSGRRYGFDFPGPMAVTGADVWVVNGLGDSVTELNAATGSLIRTVSGGRPGFSNPSAITAAGGQLWIANQGSYDGGGWVTEWNASDGSWIRTLPSDSWPRSLLHGCVFGALSAGRYRFTNPSVIAAVGSHIWIPDGRTSVTVVSDG